MLTQLCIRQRKVDGTVSEFILLQNLPAIQADWHLCCIDSDLKRAVAESDPRYGGKGCGTG